MLSIVVTTGDRKPETIRAVDKTGRIIPGISMDVDIPIEELVNVPYEQLTARYLVPAMAGLQNDLRERFPGFVKET